MIERLIEYCIRNRFFVLALTGGLAVCGIYAVFNTPMDAIPDLSENQVIVFTDWLGRSPREIEDQITYPLSLKLQGLAGVRTIRSSSEFNFSMVTIIFEDRIDYYFARQRVLEKLDEVRGSTLLPRDVVPRLAADATALGQIFWYTVESDPRHPVDPSRLWAINKYQIVPQLNSASGVAEVATVGGAPLEYQIDVQPEALRAYGVTLAEVYAAVAKSNFAAGGGVVQKNNAEYLVRFVGWIKDKQSIENTIVRRDRGGAALRVKDVAAVQLGQQFRRSVFEKDGNEVTGGVVLMRYGENPLAVTRRVKEKIQALQPALPPGVRVVPAYDRTRLINGAIHTLTRAMLEEMIIAAVAVFLILWHVRSAFVICVTLPLSVLFSFLLMWLLRVLHILDIQANIMSLAGITISIGILVDQAIVMTENATHQLKEEFGDRKVSGDTRAVVIRACRTVGRPIFFSVMIMLISFIPVFALSGREGKYFHPLAFTKSFALLGVALISVTVVPALIPTFVKGRLRREDENWIVRSFINIYKPVLTWALPRRNLVMWAFAALLILAAGIFPLQALIGQGASESAHKIAFLFVLAVVIGLTVFFTRGAAWSLLSLATLVLLALIAFHFPRIGVAFMPALDEGSTLDMPVTVPRAGITQAADDLKHRDGLLRGFPEVESVVGKAGRADTPTDPAPLDMVETFVNFRPRQLWPKRVLRFADASRQTRAILAVLEQRGYVRRVDTQHEDDRDSLIADATQKAVERFDEIMRELALRRYGEFEQDLGPLLTRFAVEEVLRRMSVGQAFQPDDLTAEYGPALAKNPALEDVVRLSQDVARRLQEAGAIQDAVAGLALQQGFWLDLWTQTAEALGAERRTFAGEVLRAVKDHRMALWQKRVQEINRELFDYGMAAYTRLALEEIAKAGQNAGWMDDPSLLFSRDPKGSARSALAYGSRLNNNDALLEDLRKPFAARVFLWPRQSGTKGDLVDDEFGRVLQVPGWSNIFTQPIVNRIEMLSTGVRTDIGIKVFGPDLDTIVRVCKDIEAVLKPIDGARSVLANPIMGKGYLEIAIDLEKAARYGVAVEDVKTTVEAALGGQTITQTVEGRERFPVRLRYPRARAKTKNPFAICWSAVPATVPYRPRL